MSGAATLDLVRDVFARIARPRPGENGGAALWRAAAQVGVSPRKAHKLRYGQPNVGADEGLLARAEAVLERLLEEDKARADAELAALRARRAARRAARDFAGDGGDGGCRSGGDGPRMPCGASGNGSPGSRTGSAPARRPAPRRGGGGRGGGTADRATAPRRDGAA